MFVGIVGSFLHKKSFFCKRYFIMQKKVRLVQKDGCARRGGIGPRPLPRGRSPVPGFFSPPLLRVLLEVFLFEQPYQFGDALGGALADVGQRIAHQPRVGISGIDQVDGDFGLEVVHERGGGVDGQ